MTGIELLAKLEAFDVEFNAELAINETKEVGANILAAQMSTGIDGNGKALKPYAPATVAYKKKYGKGLGAVTDRRTLFMTGQHYSQIYLQARAGELMTGSDDPKSKFLQEREGLAIYKMGVEAREDYAQVHFPVFKREFEKITGLKFK